MASGTTKACGNIYYDCRKAAAKYNDKLNSREGASELLGLSVSSLADYELGLTKVVPVDKVVLMADLYNAPEICNHYCTSVCPIGMKNSQKLEVTELDRLTLKLFSTFRKTDNIQDSLLEIVEDGIISDDEKPKLKEILTQLEVMSKYIQELKLWANKNME